jgi:signal transduction histidine kinase
MRYPDDSRLKPVPHWIHLTLYWALWTTIALLNAAAVITENPDLPKWKPLVWELSSMWTVGAIYPLVAWLARRFPPLRQRRMTMLALHFVFLIGFSAAHTSGMVAIRKIVYLLVSDSYTFGGGAQVLYEFYKDLILYPALLGLTAGIDYYRKYQENELRSAQLQSRLADAQLANLRAQLNPHFLFNTLNMISARMYEDAADADRMMTRLSDLLRLSLQSSTEAEVPLRTEVEMIELYLDIMRARFQDSIQIHMEIDSRAQTLMVPSMLLQPIVENAFRHGVAEKPGGCIEIKAAMKNGAVCLTVRDNGPGIAGNPEVALKKGLGLTNTAERLRALYGTGHRMEIRNRSTAEGGGLEVAIDVPARFSD